MQKQIYYTCKTCFGSASSSKDRINIDRVKKQLCLSCYVENKYKIRMTIGVSEKISSAEGLSNSFQQADTVVELGVNKGSGKIKQFDPSSLEFLFHGFSNYVTVDFSNSVLEGIDTEEISPRKNNSCAIVAASLLYLYFISLMKTFSLSQ